MLRLLIVCFLGLFNPFLIPITRVSAQIADRSPDGPALWSSDPLKRGFEEPGFLPAPERFALIADWHPMPVPEHPTPHLRQDVQTVRGEAPLGPEPAGRPGPIDAVALWTGGIAAFVITLYVVLRRLFR